MNAETTIVTAFFDINRAEKGDGRTIDEYKEWIKLTLKLNCNLFVVTEEKFKQFFIENRPVEYRSKMVVHVVDFKDSHYYKYYDQMKSILESAEYKNRIDYPNRVECRLPEYNIIQYSKFHYLQLCIEQNPFCSEYFLWMDAGISRFFLDVDISKPYPSENGKNILNTYHNKFIIEKRHNLLINNIDDNFIWRANNLLCGGMFGGSALIIKTISILLENVFQEKMLKYNNVNNEQLALAIIWKENQHIFLTTDPSNCSLYLFKILSL